MSFHAYTMSHTYIYMDDIWTISFMHYTHASFGQLYQSIYNFQINHTNHVNIFIHTYILSTCQYIRTHILTSNQLVPSMAFKLKQDNLILKTNCGIEMPTKNFTQQVITDHRIALNSVQKTIPLIVPKS